LVSLLQSSEILIKSKEDVCPTACLAVLNAKDTCVSGTEFSVPQQPIQNLAL
jgi:hypothetical protein